MKRLFAYRLCICFLLVAMTQYVQSQVRAKPVAQLDLQGHRGARGLMPENTVPAMIKAIDLGVTTLEMDVVISGDSRVVLSHEPIFHADITTTPDGKLLTAAEGEKLLLYQMNYEDIKRYDVGLKPHPRFPMQQKVAVYKPLLASLIDSVEYYARTKGKTLRYNIEIKSTPGYDGLRHPAPARFAELLLAVLRSKNIVARTTIQSFDIRPLQYLHKRYPELVLSYLLEDTPQPLDAQLARLGFVPQVYSPYYKMLTPALVAAAHQKGMQVLPWTVNDIGEMKKLVAMGVDGIISDFPDLFAQLQ